MNSPSRSTYLPISDQWLLAGLLVAVAVLLESAPLALLRLPVDVALFVAETPGTWLPLVWWGSLMVGALIMEWRQPAAARLRAGWWVAGVSAAAGALWFHRFGDLDWHATPDWIKDWTYYTALRESLAAGRLPWYLNESFQGTTLFFANPETNLAPHTLLLAWLDVETFVLAQAAAFAAFGVTAIYLLARDLALGPVASLAFLAIFLMNGHLIGHLHTGHTQWIGYFVFPWLFLFLHRAAQGALNGRTQAGLALSLSVIAWVGGLHLFVWCVIFLAVFCAADRSRWRFGLRCFALLAGLTAMRLLPAAVLYVSPDTEFVGSYQQVALLVRALVGEIRTKIDGLGWWEYDVYVGWAGLLIVAAGLTAPLASAWRQPVARLWLPSVAMAVLSLFNIYRWTLHPLPGFVSQRVASRLLILGLLGFTLIGCAQLSLWLTRSGRTPLRLAALAAAGLLLIAQLVVHTNGRRPTSDTGLGPPSVSVVSERRPDAVYAASMGAGALISLVSLGVAGRLWRRAR